MKHKRKRYDSSKIEPELGMSLDKLNEIVNDPSKWITEEEMIRRLKKIINEAEGTIE